MVLIIINSLMSNKTHSQSNKQTEDGEEQDNDYMWPEEKSRIVDVWDHNFLVQLERLKNQAKKYSVLALDTQFPGNTISKEALYQRYNEQQLEYECIKHNVQTTKLIQVGISVGQPNGTLPSIGTWQFHLKFNIHTDNSVQESIDLLKHAGIDFQKLSKEGISYTKFAQELISSGLFLNKNIKWTVFHGCYDFAYLLRLLRNQQLPKTSQDFYKSAKIYIPNIYDLKQIIKDDEALQHCGLNAIAQKIGCARIGPQHQAGSDSLLTLRSYFQLRNIMGQSHFQEHMNIIYGIKISTKINPLQTNIQKYINQNAFNNPLYLFMEHNQQNNSFYSINNQLNNPHYLNYHQRQNYQPQSYYPNLYNIPYYQGYLLANTNQQAQQSNFYGNCINFTENKSYIKQKDKNEEYKNKYDNTRRPISRQSSKTTYRQAQDQ